MEYKVLYNLFLFNIIPWYFKYLQLWVVKCSMLSTIAKIKNKCKSNFIFIFSQQLIINSTLKRLFRICSSRVTAVNAGLCGISFFSAFHIRYFHISTWSCSYLFQLVLMSNITPSETYSEYRWKFDLLKVYCFFFYLKRNSFPHFIYFF